MIERFDGRIDCAVTEKIESSEEYYTALDTLGCDSLLSGRITSVMHYAVDGIKGFENTAVKPHGTEPRMVQTSTLLLTHAAYFATMTQ